MAKIPLVLSGFDYDTESKRIVANFVDAPLPDDPDPISFVATMKLSIELLPRAVDETPVEQPEETRIVTLETVTDQLVLDILMSQMAAMGFNQEGL